MTHTDQTPSQNDEAVAEGGAYEVIRKRLAHTKNALLEDIRQLNERRISAFGKSDLAVIGRSRIRTENNCIARDILQIGNQLLFGYNVFVGLRKDIQVDDVFALYNIQTDDDDTAQSIEIIPCTQQDSFLQDPTFLNDFHALYRYYSQAQLSQLTINKGFLLASFQVGDRIDDIKVFRWAIEDQGKALKYVDNRGEYDIKLPDAFDFEWQTTSRSDFVDGDHPHINILDRLFVETIGGDLTIKIENNTASGLGIYEEPVEDINQALEDAQIAFAEVGQLILLSVKPYREETVRYFVYNPLTESIKRLDQIGHSCVRLPENHGIIFPGGIYLETGEFKIFDHEVVDFKYKRTLKSPNGEDILFIFYEPIAGIKALLSYNLINKSVTLPIIGHGYALFDTGKLAIFSAEKEPTRNHPLQFWQTPYMTDEQANQTPVEDGFFAKIGNSDLVRGISDLHTLIGFIDEEEVTSRLFESIQSAANRLFDDHYWLDDNEVAAIRTHVQAIQENSEQIIDEFEKVKSIRKQSMDALKAAEKEKNKITQRVGAIAFEAIEEFIQSLNEIRKQRGHIITLKSYRYIDTQALDQFNDSLEQAYGKLSENTLAFLQQPDALLVYQKKYETFTNQIEKVSALSELEPIRAAIQETLSQLDLVSELVSTLVVKDVKVRTQIVDLISEIYAKLNQCKARADKKDKALGASEAAESFGAQFKLFSQSIIQALNIANTPEACDEALSRLLLQLETLEGEFSQYDEFIGDIITQRDQLYETFESHKQQLLEAREQRCQSLMNAAKRVLSSIERRSLKFSEIDELNAYFVADPMIMKVHDLAKELRGLDNSLLADDLDAQFAAIKDQALRSLRDRSDIYEEGGQVIKLGPKHKFSVNTSPVDLTLVKKDNELTLHISGTYFFQSIDDAQMNEFSQYWDWHLVSESEQVYRAEYLAYLLFDAGQKHRYQLSMETLRQAKLKPDALLQAVRTFATPRYQEGYQKGIHDHDAAIILNKLINVYDRSDLLIYTPKARALAQWYWVNAKQIQTTAEKNKNNDKGKDRDRDRNTNIDSWQIRAKSSADLIQAFNDSQAQEALVEEVQKTLSIFCNEQQLDYQDAEINLSAAYLVEELKAERIEFILSEPAQRLRDGFKQSVDDKVWRAFNATISNTSIAMSTLISFTESWLTAYIRANEQQALSNFVSETAACLNLERKLSYRPTQADVNLNCDGLLGEHPNIQDGRLVCTLDHFIHRLTRHLQVDVPAYQQFQSIKSNILEAAKKNLKLESFQARPLSSFVRNRLINEVYLPLIGDNLAKQMGTLGESRRTDLMGLLMMISPPGYGKTTLMEYVANRLGLIFMKINCPSLGHSVTSLDPEQAPNSTARQELEKLNLSLVMGNNVMLYLDDIQHTDPEFLQKFISLCDGTRRIEGVWQGETKTFDLRGRKFCVVMAGNPYTESGETFKIPDMLANRADIYNLGDILGGMDAVFSLSYIENCLSSQPILAPLATRPLEDFYLLVRMAQGESIANTELSHQYSAAEINELTALLQRLFQVQSLVLKVNQAYIASAAQDDAYRTEPPFKLQGSYRNMNKMTEKISAIMNEEELEIMIDDHYRGEAQLLTAGAQSNLLKLAELRETLTEEDEKRWAEIKEEFKRNQSFGGDSDVGEKIVIQMHDMVNSIKTIGTHIEDQQKLANSAHIINRKRTLKETLFVIDKAMKDHLIPQFKTMVAAIDQSHSQKSQTTLEVESLIQTLETLFQHLASTGEKIEVINQPVPGMDKVLSALADTIEHSIFPLVRSMEKKLDIDLRTHDKIQAVLNQLRD